MKKKIKKKWLMYLLCLTCLLIPASVLSVSAREEGGTSIEPTEPTEPKQKIIPVNIEWNGYEVSENEVKVNLLDGDSNVVGTGNAKVNNENEWNVEIAISENADINSCSVEVKNENDENLPDGSSTDTYTWVLTQGNDENNFTITLYKEIPVNIEWNGYEVSENEVNRNLKTTIL